jgi:hypothetical protein
MKLFIAGCGRSGTTLIRDLMNCFENVTVQMDGPYGEANFTSFTDSKAVEENQVIKRAGDSWRTLALLPADVELIYCVRHPFDTLTSTHPLTMDLRRFHITEERWISEYRSLQALQTAQPERQIFFLRYEDLVRDPDQTQKKIADRFGLVSRHTFSGNPGNIKVFTDSIEKWRSQPELLDYLQNISETCKLLIKDFCGKFDYSLSDNYTAGLERKTFPYRFSVIIPLEFHRGQIEQCLRGWLKDQTYPADQFEVLAVACPSSLGEELNSIVKAELRPHDRLLLYDDPHDISLCAHAAFEAKGEILIFTESHCLPKPDVLMLAEEHLKQHPEWAGFSAQSLPITPNYLSTIEADMYQADIIYGMTVHPWRKILDQFFVVRSREYMMDGGFLPQLGHFSEWHLSARMHENEHMIGYVPEVQFWHYYSGDIQELIEFSRDFTQGEMRYKAEFLDDPCQGYFPVSMEWLFRFNWNGNLARRMHQLTRKAHTHRIQVFLNPFNWWGRIRFLFEWYTHAYWGPGPLVTWNRVRQNFYLILLQMGKSIKIRKKILERIFLKLIEATIRFERIGFVQRWLDHTENRKPNRHTPVDLINWTPEMAQDTITLLGIYSLEEWQGVKFRWSQPAALMELSLKPGVYNFNMEWLAVGNIKNLTVYLNETPLRITQAPQHAGGKFTVHDEQPVRFSWTCEPIYPKNDARILGLPITSISWSMEQA